MRNHLNVLQKSSYTALIQTGWLVSLLVIGLIACKTTPNRPFLPSPTPLSTLLPIAQTPINTPLISPTSDVPAIFLTPLPFNTVPSTTEVVCALDIFSITPTPNIFDSIIPGVTTKQEVEELLGLPSQEVIWQGQTQWYYQSLTDVIFENDLVIERGDLRGYLGEIVGQYGIPEQVIWRVPKRNYHYAVPRTYLLYPNKGLMFIAEGEIIITFAEDSLFGLPIVVEPEAFDELITSENIYSERDWAIPIDWPCLSE